MLASKVTFGAETRAALDGPTLTPKQKRKIRKNRVLDYIRSKPAGAPIRPKELIEASGYLSYAAGGQYIGRLLKQRAILKEEIPGKMASIWTIPGDAKTVKPGVRQPASELPNPGEPAPAPRPTPDDVAGEEDGRYGKADATDDIMSALDTAFKAKKHLGELVERQAKSFVWETGSFDLREFVKWVK